MNIISLHSLLLLVCGLIVTICWVDAAPYYSLPSLYHFDGTPNYRIPLTNLVCVKGNNARSIQFQMQTCSSQPQGSGAMIGTIIITYIHIINYIIHMYILTISIATGSLNVAQNFIVMLTNIGQIYVWGYDSDVIFTDFDGQWHTITLTYNGASLLSLYIDGAFIQFETTFNHYLNTPIVYSKTGDNNWLGTAEGYGDLYKGKLKNISFYDYALTADEARITLLHE